RVELELRRCLHEKNLVLDPARLEKLILWLASEARKASARGQSVAVTCDAALRRPLRQVTARALPELSIIAYPEIPSGLLLEPVAVLKPADMAPKADGAPTATGDALPAWNSKSSASAALAAA